MITSIKNWFRHSETIMWARIQVAAGIIWTVLSASDLSPLLNPKYLTYWLIVNGVISEWLRRRGTEVVTMNVVVPGDVKATPVTTLVDVPPPPPPPLPPMKG